MIVTIESDEQYPFYRLDSPGGDEIDVPDSVAREWRLAMAEFYRVQEEMRKYHSANL